MHALKKALQLLSRNYRYYVDAWITRFSKKNPKNRPQVGKQFHWLLTRSNRLSSSFCRNAADRFLNSTRASFDIFNDLVKKKKKKKKVACVTKKSPQFMIDSDCFFLLHKCTQRCWLAHTRLYLIERPIFRALIFMYPNELLLLNGHLPFNIKLV